MLNDDRMEEADKGTSALVRGVVDELKGMCQENRSQGTGIQEIRVS